MDEKMVLFVCVHNSARSQMAEAFLNLHGRGLFRAESAGLEPGVLNPLAVKAMKEIGIDISGNSVKSVFDLYKEGRLYSYVIAVCDEAAAERCPIFPGVSKTLRWSFEDPSSFTGSEEERLRKTARVRDRIEAGVKQWIDEMRGKG